MKVKESSINPAICNPTISLCMIVKNEEHNLPRCLDSVADAVDEIIIVDTGSTDRTIEIAEGYGARIFNHPWEGDFSKARNFSLQYATCDWILIIDADEELEKPGASALKNVVKGNGFSAVSFLIKNRYRNSTQEGYARTVRLFRNFNGVHYDGIVHNVLKYHGACLNTSITVIHHGYDLSEAKMQEKFVRTTTLLKKQIKGDPENPVPHMYTGIACMDRGMYDEAISFSKRAISLAEESGINKTDLLVSYYIVSAAYFEKGDFRASEAYAVQAIEVDNQFLDGYGILSFIYYNLKEYDRFMTASEKYLTIWSSVSDSLQVNGTIARQYPENEAPKITSQTNIIYHTIGHKWKIHLLRGFYYIINGQDKGGNDEINLARSKSTDMTDCLDLLSNFYTERKCIEKAEEALKELLTLNEKSVHTLFRLGHIMFRKNKLNEAVSYWKKAIEIEPASFDIRLLICKINIDQGNFEDVIANCDQLLQLLNISCNITIEDFNDLANLFYSIGKKLKEGDDIPAAEAAFRIYENLKQMDKIKTRKTNPGLEIPARQMAGGRNQKYSICGPTLSLCMIVKDEERLLPMCLDSVKDYVDEIIIVDTGSSDNTVEIAKRYNAKIYHHPWENSFSKARNYSLKYATCDWILILDADEQIEKEDAYKLREVIKNTISDVILIPVHSAFRNGTNISIANSERIFINHLGLHYEGIVHNNLKYSCPARNENIRLYHHGYNHNNEEMEKKFARTSALLKEQIKHDPHNPVPHHYLAISCLDREKNDECIKEALEAIRLFELQNSNTQLQLLSYYTISVAFLRKNDLINSEKYALKALHYYADYLDAYCLLSSIYFIQKKQSKCIEVTERYLSLLKTIKSNPNSVLSIPYNTIQHAKLAYSRLSIIYYDQGQREKSLRALRSAVDSSEQAWEPYLILGKHYMEQNRYTPAEEFLTNGLKEHPGNRDILCYLAEVYAKSTASCYSICFQ